MVSLFPHPASFRFHLAMDTLTFGYILPTTGRIRDLHPLETCAAGRTLIKQTTANAAACVFLEFRQKCRLNSKAQKFFVEFRDLTRPVLLAG